MKYAALIICAVLAGCATSPSHYQLGSQALSAGDLKTAETELNAAIASGDSSAWNNLGVLYVRTGRTSQAISAYQMGARHGDPVAQQNLVKRGLPVPPADLKASSSSSSSADGWAAALKAFNDGKNGNSYSRPSSSSPSRGPVFCDSTKGLGNSINTTCY